MSSYVRVFCASSVIPPLRTVLRGIASDGYRLSIDRDFTSVDLDSVNWRQVGLIYKEGKSSLLCELDKRSGPGDSLAQQEILIFEQLLAKIADSEEKQRVLQHLHQTEYIVSVQIPTDFDESCSDALGSILTYFIRYCKGMVQTDSEGFYDGDELIVELA